MSIEELLKVVDQLNKLAPPKPHPVVTLYGSQATIRFLLSHYAKAAQDAGVPAGNYATPWLPALYEGVRIDFAVRNYLPDGWLQDSQPPFKLYRLGSGPGTDPAAGQELTNPQLLPPSQ